MLVIHVKYATIIPFLIRPLSPEVSPCILYM